MLLLANGAAGGKPLAGEKFEQFLAALEEVCIDLARSIPADGEGATHLITLEISGAPNRDTALTLAKTVANSPLVKTAITGADPNWGRIVSAAGYAGVPIDPNGVTLKVNGFLLYENGAPVDFNAAEVSKSIRENRDTLDSALFQRRQRFPPVLDHRSHGRIHPPECRLSHLTEGLEENAIEVVNGGSGQWTVHGVRPPPTVH